ncbi:hypothetical protein GCM10009127_27290 [Alteraurantiacibacter aestuarii]
MISGTDIGIGNARKQRLLLAFHFRLCPQGLIILEGGQLGFDGFAIRPDFIVLRQIVCNVFAVRAAKGGLCAAFTGKQKRAE